MAKTEGAPFAPPLQALTRRADVQARTGSWENAASLYEEAFRRALGEKDLQIASRALEGLTRCRHSGERFDEAEELAQLNLELAELNELPTGTASAIHMIAVSRYFRGDLEGARSGYTEALQRAVDLGDDALIGMACQNLAILASMRGDHREGRLLCLESIAAFVRSGDTKRAVGGYNNLGIICTDLEERLEAELYFDRGIELAEQLGDIATLGILYTNRAKPLIQVDELDRAANSLTTAEQHASQTGDRGTLSEIALHRATIARLRNDYSTAAEQLDLALKHADAPQFERERTLAREGYALLHRAEGDIAEAKAAMREVAARFRRIGAERDAARAETVVASWNASDGGDGDHSAPSSDD